MNSIHIQGLDPIPYAVGQKYYDIIKKASPNAIKNVIAVNIDKVLYDLHSTININHDHNVDLVIFDNNEMALEIIRHDTAHLMAQAIIELMPHVKPIIGPVIENGFYYDFATEQNFSELDLERIEKHMHIIAARHDQIIRQEVSFDDAIKYFHTIGNHYKVDIIKKIIYNDANAIISQYQQGDFIDICRGPHSPSTKYVKYFKLLKVSGSYLHGDSSNQPLQRIYGTAWCTKEALEEYLERIQEAELRDHRRIGATMHLFHQANNARGDIFWHPNGMTIYGIVKHYIRSIMKNNAYLEVKTPQLLHRSLWEKSGHWEQFKDNMFTLTVDNEDYAIKPMNCPCHIEIFNTQIHSYKDLPLRISEFGSCHRYEPSGSLHGIMRARAFTQDDAHIFCRLDQIVSETKIFCNLLHAVYRAFGFDQITIALSDRPIKRAGDDATWDKAENALKAAIEEIGYKYVLNPGEGAFYGPKLEFILHDAIGRKWQCGTLQIDFVLPERLSAHYITETGAKENPVIIHRAMLGSIERFIGILIEHYAGKLPLWLAPVQVAVCGVNNDCDQEVKKLTDELNKNNIRAVVDSTNQTLNYKIQKHSSQKIPYIVVIGKKEIANDTVTIRLMDSTKTSTLSRTEFISQIQKSSLIPSI